MANRRMFSLDVIDTDVFLEMPLTTQALYFQLGMRADDDGFVSSPKRVLKMLDCKPDDLRILISRGYVIVFETGVIVITDWKKNNFIRNDRYKPTVYQKEMEKLSVSDGTYTLNSVGIPKDNQNGYQMDTQVRLGKDSIVYNNTFTNVKVTSNPEPENPKIADVFTQIQELYNSICKSYPRLTKISEKRKKAINARMKTGYTLEDFRRVFEKAESSDFLKGKNKRDWSATFDWLICDSNMAKVLDGNYDNAKGGGLSEQKDNVSIQLW